MTARTSSSTALILLPHKGISLFRHAHTTKIIGGSGLSLFDELLTRRREQPQDDLLSLLAAVPADDELHQDLLANCIFFLLAGHSTTTTMLCAGVIALTEHPAQLAALLSGQHSWDAAVEEVLRFVSPITLTGVTALEDAILDGCPVAAGQQRTVVYAAANRDPAVFLEPDRFDVNRAPNPHLAFSAGATFCLGAPLARLHGRVALPALFTRLPGLRLVGPPAWRGSAPVRQIERMPVSW